MVEHEDVAIAEDVAAGVPIVAGNNEVVEVNSTAANGGAVAAEEIPHGKAWIIMHEFTRRHTISQSKAPYFKLLIPFLGQNQTEKYITAIMSAIQNGKLNQ